MFTRARTLRTIGLAAALLAARPTAGRALPGPAPTPRVPGTAVEVRGEVVELDCYLREGSRGEAHRGCATTCLANGGSLAVVEDDTGRVFPLAGDAPATEPGAAVRDRIAQHVLVRGRLFERAGGRVLAIDEVERLGD